MRITNQMMVGNAIQNMTNNMEKLAKLQEKVSTQKEFQTASDNPVAASASLSLRSNLRTLQAYSDTSALTQDWMTASDSAFDKLETIANRANNLVLSGLNDTLDPGTRANVLGVEMQSLLQQAVEIGNTSQNGQYIFSGYQVNSKAFDIAADADPTKTFVVTYKGDQGSMQRTLGPGQSITLNVRGDQALDAFFQSLIAASNALKQNDTTTLQTALGTLQSSLDTMSQYRTSNGARMRQVDQASDFLESVKAETTNLLSKKEDANMAEGISLLTSQQSTYNAVLEVSQRAISTFSLFDYLK